jgi:DNA-binding NarL/FixJ family response regulator
MNPIRALITVAVVDDDPEFRRLVRETLAGAPDLRLLAECGDAEEAFGRLPALGPDVVLMDIEMPGLSGIECLRRLQPRMEGTRFMMLTVFEDYDRIFESLKGGATGYLIKKGVGSRLAEAIRELHAGESPISPSIARKVIQTFRPPTEELSQREREIVERLARGAQYKEIADDLSLSFNTVRTHVNRIYEKLHVHTRREAVARFQGRGGEA